LIIIAALRVGVSPIGKEWFGWLLNASKAFPDATSYISYSPIPVLILKLLGTSNPYVWWLLWLLIDITWIIICFKLIEKHYPSSARALQLIFIMSQSIMVNLTMIGHYDNLIFIAGSLLLFYEKKSVYFLSSVIVGGANPYLGFASGVCFIFYYFYSENKKHLEISLFWLLVNLVYLVGTHLWYVAPATGTRESIVLGQVSEVIKGSIGVWWFIPLTILGPLTLVYASIIYEKLNQTRSKSMLRIFSLFFATFLIPSAMAYLILDHTRIGVAAGGVVSLLFIFENFEKINEKVILLEYPLLTFLFVIWVLTPPIIIDSGGVFRLPYLKYIQL
jgi:hypothetical protein